MDKKIFVYDALNVMLEQRDAQIREQAKIQIDPVIDDLEGVLKDELIKRIKDLPEEIHRIHEGLRKEIATYVDDQVNQMFEAVYCYDMEQLLRKTRNRINKGYLKPLKTGTKPKNIKGWQVATLATENRIDAILRACDECPGFAGHSLRIGDNPPSIEEAQENAIKSLSRRNKRYKRACNQCKQWWRNNCR